MESLRYCRLGQKAEAAFFCALDMLLGTIVEVPMPWVMLIVAGFLETGWAIGLRYTHGFTRPLPTVLTLLCMAVSMALLGLAVKHLPVGTAYAVWTGIGTVGTAILGMVLLNEPVNATRILCIALIVGGILGLKFLAPQ